MTQTDQENRNIPDPNPSEYQHHALIVDDERMVRNALGRILEAQNITPVYARTGHEAIEHLNTAHPPFSILIADQRIPGTHMGGTDLLELARQISPNTIRFLITGHAELDTIINAVNKGAIQRFVAKPWQPEELTQAIRISLKRYERFLEKEALFTLAKKQNAGLLALTRKRLEATEAHNARIEHLDKEIQDLRTQPPQVIKTHCSEELTQQLSQYLETLHVGKQQALDQLYHLALDALSSDIHTLSEKNGIDLSPPLATGDPHEKPPPPDPGT